MAEINAGENFTNAFSSAQRNSIASGIADETARSNLVAEGLNQRKQNFNEQQATNVDNENLIKQNLQWAADTVKAATDAGKDPASLGPVIMPIISQAAKLAAGPGGQNVDRARTVMQYGQALLSRPATPLAPDNNFNSHVVTDPNTLQQSVVTVDRRNGAPQATPIKNLTDPRSTITGVTVDGQPAPDLVPAPAPTSAAPTESEQPKIGGFNAETIELRARQWMAGNDAYSKGLPRSTAGMAVKAAIENRGAQIAKEEGISAEELNARTQKFKAETAGASVLAKREATLTGAIANVVATAPIVAELSAKVNRTEYPLLNQVINAGLTNTGNKDIVRLGIAVNTVVNAYARAQGGGNNQLTDTARNEAHTLLQLAFSDGQMQAGVDQLLVEMQREKHEQGRALNDYLKLRDGAIKQSGATPPTNRIIDPQSGIGFTITPPGR